jgi:hypothetical protein
VILGADPFRDGNEIGSALGLFDKIIEVADSGVSHVVYDRLMQGTRMRHLMTAGVIPVVAMPQANTEPAACGAPSRPAAPRVPQRADREKRKGNRFHPSAGTSSRSSSAARRYAVPSRVCPASAAQRSRPSGFAHRR